MAIRFGMTIAEMIAQLTRGFRSVAGRNPDGLEKIKIQQEAVQRFKDMNKVVDMQGKAIDTSKGIMGGKQIQDSPEFGKKIRETYDKAKGPGKGQEMVDALGSPGARRSYEIMEAQLGVRLYGDETFDEILEIQKTGKHPRGEPKFDPEDMADARLINDMYRTAGPRSLDEDKMYLAEFIAEEAGKVLDDLPASEQKIFIDRAEKALKKNVKKYQDPENMAQGGRIGYKDGPDQPGRRKFMKIMGGLAAVPIVGKFFKLAKVGQKVKQVPVIKTDDVAGKPEWFDALVNKVITEGDDVTKRFATGERQSIHQKTLDDGSVVRVTEDVDDGAVRVEYESSENVFGDPVQMEYKKPLPDETIPDPAAKFTTAESGPVGRAYGPDDFEIEIEEVGGSSIRDLDSDVSKLKEYATGKKPTMKELVQNIDRRKKAKRITEDPEAQSDAVIARQGEMLDYDTPDDFASGGIARMLGE